MSEHPDTTPATQPQAPASTYTTLPLSKIKPGAYNPRTVPGDVEGMAASIEAETLLHNLVVEPVSGRVPYRLVAGGETRFAALKLLQKRGKLAKDYESPVIVLHGLTDEDRKRLPIIENIHRQNLHPLDEADAWASLLEGGTDLDDIAARTGWTVKTIRQRLTLHSLCDTARQALREQQISLGQAQALSLGTTAVQEQIVSQITEGTYWFDAEEIRDAILEQCPTVSMALFPLEQYDGRITEDWFSDDDSRYFEDTEQFMRLQAAAVEALAQKYRDDGAAWVQIDKGRYPDWWPYKDARKGSSKAGVVIWFGPTGETEIKEGLVKRDVSPTITGQLEDPRRDTTRSKPPRPAYGPSLCREIRRHKTLAVQAALIANPRKARELAVMQLLGAYAQVSRLSPHDALWHTSRLAREGQEPTPPSTYATINDAAKPLLEALHQSPQDDTPGPAWSNLMTEYWYTHADLYQHVKGLSDTDLESLHLALPVLAFGQVPTETLDTGDSLFNLVAQDLAINMREHWRPDATFLSMRTKAQLMEIAQQSGATEAVGPMPSKKPALVQTLADYFADDSAAARAWTPDAMTFPAVDPNNPAPPDDDTDTHPVDEPQPVAGDPSGGEPSA